MSPHPTSSAASGQQASNDELIRGEYSGMDLYRFPQRPVAHFGLLIWVIALLALVEIALEWRASERGYDTLIWHVTSAPNGEAQLPFRSAPVSERKARGVTRLWIAGASHAEDVYIPVGDVFPSRVCDELSRAGSACDLVNGSQAGTGIEGNLEMLEAYGPAYRPDWILLYQGTVEIRSLSRHSFASNSAAQDAGASARLRAYILDPVRQALESTTLYAHLTQELRTRVMSAKRMRDDLPATADDLLESRLVDFIELTRTLGATPVLTTFATRYRSDQIDAVTDEDFRSLVRYDPHLSAKGWLSSVARFNAVVSKVAADRGVQVIDIASGVTGDALAFRDFSHFTPYGHARVATIISATLRDLWQQRDAHPDGVSAR